MGLSLKQATVGDEHFGTVQVSVPLFGAISENEMKLTLTLDEEEVSVPLFGAISENKTHEVIKLSIDKVSVPLFGAISEMKAILKTLNFFGFPSPYLGLSLK